MDGIDNIAKQQQAHMSTQTQNKEVSQAQQANIVEEMQQEITSTSTKINSKEQVEDLVKELNNALSPMKTNLKFGVDAEDIFFVSVIESKTSKMIRRFPAEQAADFLPKMQEVSGILFDSKG